MPTHSEEQILPYHTQHIYDLVADVEHYPEFLPWCRAARILERGEREFLGELVICYKHVCEQYTSRVSLTPPETPHSPCKIAVSLVRGPFHHLDNMWEFIPEGENTRVKFYLDFAFKSRLLEMMLGGFFHKAAGKMVEAFRKRAAEK